MRILVCGGRAYTDKDALWSAIDAIVPRTSPDEGGNRLPFGVIIIHGGASGADKIADNYAIFKRTSLKVFEAEWSKYGRSAGPKRNQRMIDEGKPDICVAASGGSGTRDMVTRCVKAGIPVVHVP